jgi:uncharacterized protein (DUF4415 family)
MSKKSYIGKDDEILELDEQWFREAKPTREIPELVEILERHGKLGRPTLPPEERKQRVTMYLDRDVVDALKENGRGWQTRANQKLRQALGLRG